MTYLVMECGLSYAVVLDSRGRFLKVPNLGYEVGQELDRVVLFQEEKARPALRWKGLAAAAACLCLVALGGWRVWQAPQGSVILEINPKVYMEVNRFDRVVSLSGMNEDGALLLENVSGYGQSVTEVSDRLADRAVELGYLDDGGQITLTVESEREEWITATQELLVLELEVHFQAQQREVVIVTQGGQQEEVPVEEPTPPPVQVDPEPNPPPAQPEPKPVEPPIQREPEPVVPPAQSVPKPVQPSVQPEPEPPEPPVVIDRPEREDDDDDDWDDDLDDDDDWDDDTDDDRDDDDSDDDDDRDDDPDDEDD